MKNRANTRLGDSEGGCAPLPNLPPNDRLRGQSPRSKRNIQRSAIGLRGGVHQADTLLPAFPRFLCGPGRRPGWAGAWGRSGRGDWRGWAEGRGDRHARPRLELPLHDDALAALEPLIDDNVLLVAVADRDGLERDLVVRPDHEDRFDGLQLDHRPLRYEHRVGFFFDHGADAAELA